MPKFVVAKQLRIKGLIVMNFTREEAKALPVWQNWVATGQIRVTGDTVIGCDCAERALNGPPIGDNRRKRVVHLAGLV